MSISGKKTTIVTWNVNGIRSNIITDPEQKFKITKQQNTFEVGKNSNFQKLVDGYQPDILCLQETRCDEKIFKSIVSDFPYADINQSTGTQRGRGAGYSGTAIFSKIEPINITKDLPTLPDVNNEGRCITAEFTNMYVVNVYTPNSGTNEDFRINIWDPAMLQYLNDLKSTGKDVVLVGDMNVCHKEEDVFAGFPSASQRVAGLLPEERDGFDKYIQNGFIDSFRNICPDQHDGYTWWNPRIKQFREQNKGWRIDYALTSRQNILKVNILKNIYGSDHCPYLVELDTS